MGEFSIIMIGQGDPAQLSSSAPKSLCHPGAFWGLTRGMLLAQHVAHGFASAAYEQVTAKKRQARAIDGRDGEGLLPSRFLG